MGTGREMNKSQRLSKREMDGGKITSSQAAHWALNCGDEGRVWDTYLRDKEMQANDKQGINFRLARKYSKGNPYRKLVNYSTIDKLEAVRKNQPC